MSEALCKHIHEAIYKLKLKLICEATTHYEPKLVAYVGEEQWMALKKYSSMAVVRNDLTTGDLEILGAQIILVRKDNYFRLVEDKL